MVKNLLVKNYVKNHNQSISYGIDSAHFFSELYLVMCINLGIQEGFFLNLPHAYAHNYNSIIILVVFCDMNNSIIIKKLIHILLVVNLVLNIFDGPLDQCLGLRR